MRRYQFAALLVSSLALAACDNSAEEPVEEAAPVAAPVLTASADLMTADGKNAGTVTATALDGAVGILLNVSGIAPGEHGVHVHMTGACEAPGFESAGGHWNPSGAAHGLEGEPGQHAGDMPNLTVAADGTGTLEYTLVGGGFTQMMDGDGAAFVVHEDADDQVTDPSGNSGARIACGVFKQN